MRPGDSTSGVRDTRGTLGAVVGTPGSGDHFITCGHVLDAVGTKVHQSGILDADDAGRAYRHVGATVQNALHQGTSDAALAKIDSGFAMNGNHMTAPRQVLQPRRRSVPGASV